MGRNFTWKKEKLKSRKRIERVFKEGRSFALFPYRVYFLLEEVRVRPASGVSGAEVRGGADRGEVGGDKGRGEVGDKADRGETGRKAGRGEVHSGGSGGGAAVQGPLHAGFGASKRNFKRAVDRNRIKRLSREGYRLQKEPLLRRLEEKGLSMAVFFIYTGRDLPDYPTVTEKIGVALHKLIKEIR